MAASRSRATSQSLHFSTQLFAANFPVGPKKLNAKQNVQIFREDQVDSLIDYDSQRAAIETGVEKAEEAVRACHLLSLTHPPVDFVTLFTSRCLLSHPHSLTHSLSPTTC